MPFVQGEEIQEQGEELRRVEERTRARHITALGRHDGETPYAITKLGDETSFWATTGLVASGGVTTVPLTQNRQALGENVFTRIPEILFLEEVSGNQLSRSTGPSGPSIDLRLCPPANATYELKWVGADQRWEVIVTNSGSAERDFVVVARGL